MNQRIRRRINISDNGTESIISEIESLDTKIDTSLSDISSKADKALSVAESTQKAKGPKGDKGEVGEKGDIGIRGEAGQIGPQGIQGEKGDTGEQGPRGYNGDDGIKGKDGTDGKDGKDAVIDDELLESVIDKKVLPGMAKIDGRIKAIDQRWGGHGGGSKGGVTSLNGETGALNIVAGSNITVTPSGQNITIASSGGGTPGGSSGDIQFNNAGSFGGETLVPLANGGTALSNIITTLTTNGIITAMPVASSIIRYASSSGATIEGIVAPSGSQRIILQCAFGSIPITLKNQNAGATATNRLQLQNGQDLALTAGTQVELFYNTVDSRWEQADFRSPVGVNNGLSTQNIFSNAGGTPGGVSNIVFGNGAISSGNFIGSNAVILGTNAAKNATNTNDLIAIGNGAAQTAILTGGENIFIGSNTGALTTSGSANLFVGGDNGQSNTTGQGNVYLGGSSGLANTTGSQNVGIGFDAGGTNITGSNQIMIGAGTQVQSVTNLNNVIGIGTSVRPTTADTMLLGGTSSPVNVGINNDTPAYRMDVGGDVNVTGAFRVNGVSQNPWTLSGNAGTSPGTNFLGTTDFEDLWIYTNDTLVQKITASGLSGFQQTTPIATVHAGVLSATVGSPASVFASLGFASSGYTFGSGDKNYSVYGSLVVSGTQIFSVLPGTVTFTEPATSTFDPSGASASFQTGGGGYTASGYDFTYTIWALYNGQTQISFGNSVSPDTGSDPNDGSNYNVFASWSAPGGPAPDAYLVYITGSNPNAGQYQVVSGTSFTDSNSGWTSSASYGSLIYTVTVSYTTGASATSYRTLNTTSGTFEDDTVPSQEVIDDGTWSSGSTVTPTVGSYPSLAVDGNVGFFLTSPVGQQTGDVSAAQVAYGLMTSPFYNNGLIQYGTSGSYIFSGSTMFYLDGSTFADFNAHSFNFGSGATISSTGVGSFNTINIGSPISSFASSTGQIFRSSSSGTLSFNDGSVHSILLDSVALTGAGEVTGILQSNNGGTGSDDAVTTVSGSTSGTAKFAQPFKGNFKKVTIQLAALLGTASYTFPQSFINTPIIILTSGLASTKVTSLSNTAVTITGTTDTGYLTVEGI